MRRTIVESKAYDFLNQVIDVIYVGLLWLVVSLPVVTIGPASAALYYTMAKTIRRGRGTVTATFFSAFRDNLKQGLLIWLIYLGYLLLGAVDFYAVRLMGFAPTSLMGRISQIYFLPALLTLPWIFAFLSRFSHSIGGTFKYTAYLAVQNFGRTVLLVALLSVCILVAWLWPILSWLMPGACCLAATYITDPVFRKLTEQNAGDDNEDRWYNET